MLARLPFGSSKSWQNIDHSYMDEKRNMDLLGYMPDAPPPVLHRGSQSDVDYSFHPVYAKGAPSQYTETIQGQTVELYRSERDSRASHKSSPRRYEPSESSLSSAFGNGTHVPPTPSMHQPRGRDTVYTQASEATTVPRFRTINSWVQQQGDRTKKNPVPVPVPEQRFTMMMPDGELPRRVA